MNNIIPIDKYLEFVEESNDKEGSIFRKEIIESGIDPKTPLALAILQYSTNTYREILSAEDWPEEDRRVAMALLKVFEESMKPIGEADMNLFDLYNDQGLRQLIEYTDK